MISDQDQMSEQLRQFIEVCKKLENNNSGLTEFFFQSKFAASYKANEKRLEKLFEAGDSLGFNIRLISTRNDWLMAVNEFKKVQKEIL